MSSRLRLSRVLSTSRSLRNDSCVKSGPPMRKPSTGFNPFFLIKLRPSRSSEVGPPLDPTILPTGNDELDTLMRNWQKRNRGDHGN